MTALVILYSALAVGTLGLAGLAWLADRQPRESSGPARVRSLPPGLVRALPAPAEGTE